jgi:hypothetical protein
VINGESRPLDVPPMIYQGVVLVPVRVISEGMGAYVQWVPDRHIVVVRYIPATPPPSPAPPPPSVAPPPPSPPPPTPKPLLGEAFVAGDYIFSPRVYNEFSPGNTGSASYSVRGGGEFSLGNIPFMLEGSYDRWQYPHNCSAVTPGGVTHYAAQCYVTTIGGAGSYPLTTATGLYDQNADVRLAVRVLQPRIYIGVGYLWMSNNYGYPNMNSWGFGGEKLADYNQPLSVFGSVWYYPNVKGTYNNLATAPIKPLSYQLAYNVLKYQVGVNYVVGKSPVFIEAGWMGENWSNKQNAPIGRTYNGPFAGLGFRLLYP